MYIQHMRAHARTCTRTRICTHALLRPGRARQEDEPEAKRPRCIETALEEAGALEDRVRLGSKVRYDLLSEEEQKEWRRRRTAVVHRTAETLQRALKLSEEAKTQKQQLGQVATQQAEKQKELTQRAAELAEAEEMVQAFTDASLILVEAGLEDFPRLFADAVVSGALSVDSLYALRLSDGAANISKPKTKGWRHSETVKIVCAIAKTRQRCASSF